MKDVVVQTRIVEHMSRSELETEVRLLRDQIRYLQRNRNKTRHAVLFQKRRAEECEANARKFHAMLIAARVALIRCQKQAA